jgi:hypothetical protein
MMNFGTCVISRSRSRSSHWGRRNGGLFLPVGEMPLCMIIDPFVGLDFGFMLGRLEETSV